MKMKMKDKSNRSNSADVLETIKISKLIMILALLMIIINSCENNQKMTNLKTMLCMSDSNIININANMFQNRQ